MKVITTLLILTFLINPYENYGLIVLKWNSDERSKLI